MVAQLNPAVPRTLGDAFVHVGRFAATLAVDEAPAEEAPAAPTALEEAIGAHVAGLVEDGATLQLGIGAIPNAVLAALRGHRDLGVHSEMFSDGVVDLVEAGVITGARKPVHAGKVVASFVVGTRRTYAFVHDNPMVALHPCDYTNDTALIRRHPAMTAINSALQIDLTGQVCADSLGPRVYSGVGGQMDFMRGAALAPRGKPIIALPATARGGTLSRIVPTLTEGAGVTTSRAHVHHVVTEYGVAERKALMKVLVTAASKHGTTTEIAEAIADVLRSTHLDVDVLPAATASRPVADYDAVVLGTRGLRRALAEAPAQRPRPWRSPASSKAPGPGGLPVLQRSDRRPAAPGRGSGRGRHDRRLDHGHRPSGVRRAARRERPRHGRAPGHQDAPRALRRLPLLGRHHGLGPGDRELHED